MITEYIGSIEDFLSCKKVAFCYIKSTISLILADIESYTIDNPFIFEMSPKVVTKEYQVGFDEPVFQCNFSQEDKDAGYVVNYLIMYNAFNKPIGFVNLQQNILIYQYSINSITLEFHYEYDIESTQLVLDITYTPHEQKTKRNLAHRILFDDKVGQRGATSRSNLLDLEPERVKFARDLVTIFRDKNKLFRYSGYLAQNYNYFRDDSYSIMTSILKEGDEEIYQITGILDTKKGKYLVLWSREKSKLFSLETGEEILLNFQIVTPYHIANNFIVETFYRRYKTTVTKYQYIHLTNVVVNKYVENTRVSPVQMTKTSIFDGDDLVLDETYRFCKDPFTNELFVYKKSGTVINYLSKGLKDIISDFGDFSLKDKEILYASKGLLILGTYDTECFEVKKIQIYNYNLPGAVSKKLISPDYHIDDEALEVLTNDKNTGILDLLEIDRIVPITPDLILIQSGGKDYLLEAYLDDEDVLYKVSLKVYPFRGHYKYKNLKMVTKDYTPELTDYNLAYFTFETNLYKITRDDSTVDISRL